jgi:hypothetical protein
MILEAVTQDAIVFDQSSDCSIGTKDPIPERLQLVDFSTQLDDGGIELGSVVALSLAVPLLVAPTLFASPFSDRTAGCVFRGRRLVGWTASMHAIRLYRRSFSRSVLH